MAELEPTIPTGDPELRDVPSSAAPEGSLRQSLSRLHKARRGVALGSVAVTWVLLVGALVTLWRLPSWSMGAFTFLLVGAMQYRLVMSCHEAVHRTLVPWAGLNELIGVLHGALVGINHARYRRQHFQHHRARRLEQDPDAYIYRPIIGAPAGWRRAAVWVFGQPAEIIEKFRQKGLALPSGDERAARWHSLALVLVQGVVFASLTIALGWWAYVALWLAPLLSIAVFINRTRVTVEHGYARVVRHAASPEGDALTTIDLVAGPIERFFLAPFHFNLHGAHHLYPAVPHYELPALHALLVRSLGDFPQPVAGGYGTAMMALLRGARR
jgi:fatty acid desaturase